MLEIDGARFLIDPVFSERVSPDPPRRARAGCTPCPGRIAEIPTIDAVLISHDHYDHLDHPSIVRLEETHQPHYVVPLGVNAHLLAWGVPAERITALDWRDETEVAGIRLDLHRGPAQLRPRARRQPDPLGRVGPARTRCTRPTSPATRARPSASPRIGADLGPFDLTLMPIGAYDSFWPDIHMDPEQALAAHRDVNRIGSDAEASPATRRVSPTASSRATSASTLPGGTHEEGERTTTTRTVETAARESLLVPLHWATFNLSMHWWAEPIRGSSGRRRGRASPSPAPASANASTSRPATPAAVAACPLHAVVAGPALLRMTGTERRRAHQVDIRLGGNERLLRPAFADDNGAVDRAATRAHQEDPCSSPSFAAWAPPRRRCAAVPPTRRTTGTASSAPTSRTHLVATAEAEGPGSLVATMLRECGHGRPRGDVPLVRPRHPPPAG